jgi:uncharacterized protein (DUF608 family)
MIVTTIVVCGSFLTSGKSTARDRAEHLVPPEKGLDKGAVQRLIDRGRPDTYTGSDLETIGMPIGGIAAGQLYLRGDGTLGVWQIFNRHVFTGYGRDNYRTYRPDSPVDSGFGISLCDGVTVWRTHLTKYHWNIRFTGEYPIGSVIYSDPNLPAPSDPNLPVRVEMEAFSPFIPLNARDSALPATIFHITLENISDKRVDAKILGMLENAVLIDSEKSVLANRLTRIVEEKGRTLLVHTAEKAPPPERAESPRQKIVLADFEGSDYGDWVVTGEAFGKAPARGTLTRQQKVSGYLGDGLVNTFLGGDAPTGTLTSPEFTISRKFINFLIGGGNHVDRTCMNLLVDGKAVRTAVGKSNEKLEGHFWRVEEFEGRKARLQIVDNARGGWGHINIDQIELSDEPQSGPVGPIEELPDYGSMVLAFAGKGPDNTWPPFVGFMHPFRLRHSDTPSIWAEPVTLEAGSKKTFTFVLSWFFPNHPNGREYANRFDSASDVAHYVLDNHERLVSQTRKWHKTFYEDSTLPRWLLFRLHSTVCNMATGTCQWWKSGRFWAWEGVGCCTGTCTHVWNYAHAPARLFPELERSAREMQDFGEGFESETGLVGFRSNRRYAADGQCGTVLKAYREHQMSADDAFLRRNWPRIRKTLEYTIGRDGNDDGIIEDSQHNTFDIEFYGPNTFVGSLYLAALRAGEEMAKEMGDEAFANRCRKIFVSGSKLTVERLWDGEYFVQIVDLKEHPKHQYAQGCLSDQLFGQGWAHQLGLGYIYSPEYVKKALDSVWKYNWAHDVGPYNAEHKPERWFARPTEPGLFTCTWPKSPYMEAGVRYRSEVWTGIEYQVAGHMAAEGMVDEALTICDGIQKRYHPSKHNPYNEVECGDHYARAFASWGVYTSLAGYEYHGPKGHIGFAPRITPENFRAAFTAAEGWGTFAQQRDGRTQHEQIEVRWGKLNVKTLAFEVPERFRSVKVGVTLDGGTIPSNYTLRNGRLEITLKKKLLVSEGQTLSVAIERS